MECEQLKCKLLHVPMITVKHANLLMIAVKHANLLILQ